MTLSHKCPPGVPMCESCQHEHDKLMKFLKDNQQSPQPGPTEDKMSDNEKCQNELKPCPFCGEAPEWDDPTTYSLLYCKNCFENTGRTVDCVGDTREEVIERWNTRPTAEIKALQDKIAELENMAIALDMAQAFIRNGRLEKGIVLREIDQALENNPVKMERL